MKTVGQWRKPMIGAVIAGLACLAPPVLILMLGSAAMAFIPAWLDLVLVPVFLILTGTALYLWFQQRRSRSPDGDLSHTKEG
ncbi:MAG: hypothetical protein JKY63_05000 [Rhodobiaceae bacterium]|nr:hypothetical protein [Rhodobiaceae bacterium]